MQERCGTNISRGKGQRREVATLGLPRLFVLGILNVTPHVSSFDLYRPAFFVGFPCVESAVMDLLSPPAPKRRKVRKGTRSCWECRRRKAKCIYSASGPDDNVCDACRSRGAKCVSQDIVDEGEALQQSKSKRRATISATTPPDETASFATASHNDAAFMQSNIAQHDVSQYGDRAQLHSPQRYVLELLPEEFVRTDYCQRGWWRS